VDSLRPRLHNVRWTQPNTIHLTLRFIGEATPEQVERLRAPLAAAAAACPPSDVAVGGLGVFPERGAPRVLWLATALAGEVLDLQRACEAAVVAAGATPEPKPFRSHVTLGRWRGPARRPELPAVDLGVARLSTLVLFKSELAPRGAVHEPLASFALGG
jgi:RNA 2',3'-cyclic 3'-phosphodiesterase